jgi:hypothetical protein
VLGTLARTLTSALLLQGVTRDDTIHWGNYEKN